MDVVTYALAKKYVNKTATALGAVKGAPCTIKTITETDIEIIVTFEWTGTDGTTQTSTITIPKGKSLEFQWRDTELGVRVEGDTEYEYVDLRGFSPTATVEKIDNVTTITVTDKNGTTTAQILDGNAFASSDTKPTEAGKKIGEIVLNGKPEPGGYIGWVYTALGWYAFGEIEKDDVAFILSDGSAFTLSDGNAFYIQP